MSIRSIRHRGLKRLYTTGDGRDLPAALVGKISDILLAIDEAARPQEVGLFPGWRLHPLKVNLKGFWSVTVSGNRRVIFRFEKGAQGMTRATASREPLSIFGKWIQEYSADGNQLTADLS